MTINIKNFASNLLKIDKKSYKNIAIYYIGYVTKKDKHATNSVNPLYFIVNKVDDFIEEKEGSKYLNFAFTDSYNEVLKKYAEIWSRIKNQIKAIDSSKSGEYGKEYMNIKFISDDDFPLDKPLKFHNLTIIIRSGRYHPQIFLDECLYEF